METPHKLTNAIASSSALFVRQRKEWKEIFLNFEFKNRYEILDESRNSLGAIAEQGQGVLQFFKRLFFRSHRAFEIHVVELSGQLVLALRRSFFFFFSDLYVTDKDNQLVGSIHRRFGIIHKKYDLKDVHGRVFARVHSPIWRLWTFPIIDEATGNKIGEVAKKWGGALKEVFSDADTFMVQFGLKQPAWTSAQRAVIFAAAISIDFDFFENNQGRNTGPLDFIPGS